MGSEAKIYKLKKITPRTLKGIQPFIEFREGTVYIKEPNEIWKNAKSVQAICENCFDEDFSKVDFEDIDLTVVRRSFTDFLKLAFSS